GERLPRLVRIDRYDVEAVPEGHMLFTRHDDRPGVVGALGSILGRENINISRMQVGNANDKSEAIALIGISTPLSERAREEIQALAGIRQVVQFTLLWESARDLTRCVSTATAPFPASRA